MVYPTFFPCHPKVWRRPVSPGELRGERALRRVPRGAAEGRAGAAPALSPRLSRHVHRALALCQGYLSLGQLPGAATATAEGGEHPGEMTEMWRMGIWMEFGVACCSSCVDDF